MPVAFLQWIPAKARENDPSQLVKQRPASLTAGRVIWQRQKGLCAPIRVLTCQIF